MALRKFVIRSMSTSDAPECKPYHVYLMKPEHRRHAYWTPFGSQIMQFDTLEEAEAEWKRIGIDGRGRRDIAPTDCTTPVWEKINHRPEIEE